MKYKNYFNFELGNRDIYSHNDILGMTVQDLFDQELPLSYQYNTIGIPKDDELKASPNTYQYRNANGKLRWRSSSKTTEDLLEEEHQRRLAQEAQTQMPQSALGFALDSSVEDENILQPQTERPFINAAKNYLKEESVSEKDSQILPEPQTELESNSDILNSQNLEPNYYEENLPADDLDDDEMWDDLRKEIKHSPLSQAQPQVQILQQDNEFQDVLPNGKTLLKGSVEETIDPYQLIQEDSTLSVEEKIAKIKELSDLRIKEIEKEHKKNMARILGGGALEIGSYFIPGTIGAKAVGGLTKIMAPAAKKLLPLLGKNLSNILTKSAAEGIASSPIAALGDEMVRGKDVSESIIPDTLNGIKQNVEFGLFKSLAKNVDALFDLDKYKYYNDLPLRQKRRLYDKAVRYYDNYMDGTFYNNKTLKEWLRYLRSKK